MQWAGDGTGALVSRLVVHQHDPNFIVKPKAHPNRSKGWTLVPDQAPQEKIINNLQPTTYLKEVSQFQISNWVQHPIFLLEIGPIPFVGLDLINPRA